MENIKDIEQYKNQLKDKPSIYFDIMKNKLDSSTQIRTKFAYLSNTELFSNFSRNLNSYPLPLLEALMQEIAVRYCKKHKLVTPKVYFDQKFDVFGCYYPLSNSIMLSISFENSLQLVDTIIHELTHCKQYQNAIKIMYSIDNPPKMTKKDKFISSVLIENVFSFELEQTFCEQYKKTHPFVTAFENRICELSEQTYRGSISPEEIDASVSALMFIKKLVDNKIIKKHEYLAYVKDIYSNCPSYSLKNFQNERKSLQEEIHDFKAALAKVLPNQNIDKFYDTYFQDNFNSQFSTLKKEKEFLFQEAKQAVFSGQEIQ